MKNILDARAVMEPRRPRSRTFALPKSSPVFAVCFLVGALPIWWLLGVEQIVWPIAMSLIALGVALERRTVPLDPVLGLLALFLGTYAISALFIVEPDRYVTYLRNLSTYVSALFVLYVLMTTVRTWQQVRRILRAILFAMGVASVLGFLAILGLARPTFASPFGMLLPDWITATAFGSNIASRTVGWTSWFSVFGEYFRVKSIFLWPTTYAPALAFTIPIACMFFAQSRRLRSRALYGALALLMLVNLAFTTGRMAMIGLVAGGLYWFFFRTRRATHLTRAVMASLALVISLGAFAAAPRTLAPDQLIADAVYARGSGSPDARILIYRRTIEGALERPIFGWGTERDIRDVSSEFIYPAGSHSYILGTLYKQGLAGFAVFVALWVAIWRLTRPWRPETGQRCSVTDRKQIAEFFDVGRWIVVSVLITSLTTVLDLDATLLFFLFVIIGCLAALRRPTTGRAAAHETEPIHGV